MTKLRNKCVRGFLSVALSLGIVISSSGCATLAHRNNNYAADASSRAACGEPGQACTWLIGDAVLLVFGIIPGVIAFAVDLGTGAWRHDDVGVVGHAEVAGGQQPAVRRASNAEDEAQPAG